MSRCTRAPALCHRAAPSSVVSSRRHRAEIGFVLVSDMHHTVVPTSPQVHKVALPRHSKRILHAVQRRGACSAGLWNVECGMWNVDRGMCPVVMAYEMVIAEVSL